MLTTQTISESIKLATKLGQPVMQVLEENSTLIAHELTKALAELWQFRYFSMLELHEHNVEFDKLPYIDSVKKGCVALREPAGKLYVAISDPFNADLQDWVSARIQEDFRFSVCHKDDIAALLKKNEENMLAMDGMVEQKRDSTKSINSIEELSFVKINADSSQVVKLVNSTLYDALKTKVSDIHLEADAHGLVIKYRLDGVLDVVTKVEGVEVAEQVISRIKIMAELDIAERRVPQDGRFKIAIQNREVDFRVSIMPSIYGEDAVLRILDRSTISEVVKELRLEQLGFDVVTVKHIRKMVLEPYGMVLVTGPTGSGKTTTLYAAISEINNGKDKIITIEDPVEYQLPGVLQIPVNEKKGLTFARGLRSILRHDPDKIMVGEIRDAETAQIAIQSALTGHLVFTTVHANNVFDVISRFTHMGVDSYSFVSAMNGIISQRLVRLICKDCAVDYQPNEDLLNDSKLVRADLSSFKFKLGQGCGKCRGTGYKGRRAIAEILDLNDEVRELIVSKAPIREVKEAATRSGTRYLRDVAIDLVKAGETTLQEINRVTFVD
ncbi:MAG: type II/IV secretion system protein [Methylotenera sp.]|uniref:GspE/PulE family protein n=1 Tax=Methylotenera sp. TaxID=2051956 RepID=UPI0017B12A89|nr:GspE/PulE family protein [Methylotenera sp.]NOU25010.1 type II/IV secretion system protein [Methylotenera sp.]